MIARHHMRSHKKFSQLALLAFCVLLIAGVLILLQRQSDEQIIVPACEQLTASQYFAAADVVLTGEVFLVVPDGAENAKVLITPDRLYKGDLPATGIAIAAKAGSDGMERDVTGELHFASGQPPYLLYLEERADGLFTTSRCAGSRLLGEGLKNEEQLILGVGQAPT